MFESKKKGISYTRIVRLEGNDQVATGRHHGNVPAGRIDQPQGIGLGGVEVAVAGAQDPEVMTVQMHRVVLGERRVHHDVHPLVDLIELDHLLLPGPGAVAVGHLHQGRVLPGGAHRRPVRRLEQRVVRYLHTNFLVVTGRKVVSRIDGDVGNEVGRGLIRARVGIVVS